MKHAIQHIHLVGIGGSGMSGIAEVLHRLGYTVSGSDLASSSVTDRLTGLGLRIAIGHAAGHVGGADVVVTSSAVAAENPEVVAARAQHVPVVQRAVMLAELMRSRQGIAIAGTHGKTTTTGLVTAVLKEAGLDPSFVIGGKLNSAGAYAQLGTGEHIVVEADESDASFLHLLPVLSVVTNIDADHMDTYGHDLARLRMAFVQFLHRMPFYGAAVVCVDDPGVRAVLPMLSRPVLSYGVSAEAMVRATEIQALAGGGMRFVCLRHIRKTRLPALQVQLNLAGHHNVLNALAAIAVAAELRLADDAIQRALAAFGGVGRRFQRYGELPVPSAQGGGHFTLIDDYGHHPVEMAAVLSATRGAFPGQRLLLAFQPHRYTRTRDCFDDFVKVMSQADTILLTEVFAAGEPPLPAADGQALARALQKTRQGHDATPIEWIANIEKLPDHISRAVRNGDVVLTMGAGSIGAVPKQLTELLGVNT
jgi:UDP-N-acetylmuramate--alanine ligase